MWFYTLHHYSFVQGGSGQQVVMKPVPYFAENPLEMGFYITMVNCCAVMLKYQCGIWEKWEIG